jgi:hypothetical protein
MWNQPNGGLVINYPSLTLEFVHTKPNNSGCPAKLSVLPVNITYHRPVLLLLGRSLVTLEVTKSPSLSIYVDQRLKTTPQSCAFVF